MSIVCVLKNVLHRHFFTYSLIFPGKPIDESRYMLEIGKFTDTNQKFCTLDPDSFVSEFEDFVRAQEEPVTSLSVYGQVPV